MNSDKYNYMYIDSQLTHNMTLIDIRIHHLFSVQSEISSLQKVYFIEVAWLSFPIVFTGIKEDVAMGDSAVQYLIL